MSARISPIAASGSLFKGDRTKHKAAPKRDYAPDHLALIRRCPCISCDQDPAGEAAHYRASDDGKPITGVGVKPDDKWTLPLCHACHMRQHAIGELKFWSILAIAPLVLALKLYRLSGDIEAMRMATFAAREGRL